MKGRGVGEDKGEGLGPRVSGHSNSMVWFGLVCSLVAELKVCVGYKAKLK